MDIAELKATQVLDDCQRALNCMENVPDEDKQLFRIHWTFCLLALRSVEEVLLKHDVQQYPAIKPLWTKRRAELVALKRQYGEQTSYDECGSDDYLAYHRLIHGEQNDACFYDVTPPYVDEMWGMVDQVHAVNWGNTYLPMADTEKWGMDDCREWLQRGIDWWRKEIAALVEGMKQNPKRKRK